jgi:hypothetical protein
MKMTGCVSVMTGLLACAIAAFDAGGAQKGRRANPNAEENIPSPFRGTVVNVSGTTLVVRGVVKGKAPGAGKGGDAVDSRSVSFSLKPEVAITRNGKPAEVKDIQKDDFVAVTFSVKKGSSLKHVTAVAVGKDAAVAQEKPAGGKKKKK